MRFSTLCALAVMAWVACATQVDADDAPTGSWLGRWFNFGKRADRKDLDDGPLQSSTLPAVSQREKAEAAYHRRLEVCLKLERIANSTDDEALRIEVELLKQQIWERYLKMTTNNVPDR